MNSHIDYFPVTPQLFSLLAMILMVVAVLVYLRVLRIAYSQLDLSPGAVLFLLAGSLLGSYINIPIAHFPEQTVVVRREIDELGFRFVTPAVVDWPGAILAVNVGGALIPVLLSLYLLIKRRLWGPALLATAGVALVSHSVAFLVPGEGIAMPFLTPPLATVVIVRIISAKNMAPLAYISGSLGVLIGADLLNLRQAGATGAPVLSIGGAGTFDGIFLTGVVAVILASLMDDRAPPQEKPQAQT
jgi:uncharacterized membrane protein